MLHILHGLPGSGKSTFARKLAETEKTVIFSNDAWMVKLHGNNPPEKDFPRLFAAIEELQWALAEKLLRAGVDVVWDYGVWTESQRTEIRMKAERMGVGMVLYRMCCDSETAMKRVLSRTRCGDAETLLIDRPAMEKFIRVFEPVSSSEGFYIVDVDSEG